jgi:hypothetical protein
MGAGAGDPSAVRMLEVQFQTTRDPVRRLFDQSDFIRVRLVDNNAGIRTVLDTKTFETTGWAGPFSTAQKVLVRDNQTDDVVEVYVNGILVAELDASTYTGADTNRVGLTFNGNADATNKPCRALGGRIVDRPAQGTQAPGVGRPDFILFGENAAWSGVIGEDSLLQPFTQGNHDNTNLDAGQVGPLGRYVQAFTKVVTFDDELSVAVTRNRVFCTDGAEANIKSHLLLDPIDRKVYEWNITAGGAATDLLGFRLAGNHGPGVMIAAPDTNRGLLALCAKVDRTGVYAWQNFNPSDGSITPATDRAWISSVPDEIVALVEVPGETAQAGGSAYETLLMCSRSIYSVRGDPRIDGGQSTVSTSTGIFGPRAWCFDNKGNLWWIGNGGLHAMPRGSRSYTKTDGRKLPEWFELADVFRRQAILRYRASDNTILAYLTPRVGGPDEGEPSRVAVYDIATGEFTADEYHPDVGPSEAVEITGQKPEDRDIVLCGLDGFVYRYSDTARSDAGRPIDVVIDAKVVEDDRGGAVLIDTLDVDAAVGTGPVNLSLYVGPSPVDVMDFDVDEDEPAIAAVLYANRDGGRERMALRAQSPAMRFVLRQVSDTETVVIERMRGRVFRTGEARF